MAMNLDRHFAQYRKLDQHLADGSLIADQLHQLIDAILLKEIFGTLLLQGEAGIEKG